MKLVMWLPHLSSPNTSKFKPPQCKQTLKYLMSSLSSKSASWAAVGPSLLLWSDVRLSDSSITPVDEMLKQGVQGGDPWGSLGMRC